VDARRRVVAYSAPPVSSRAFRESDAVDEPHETDVFQTDRTRATRSNVGSERRGSRARNRSPERDARDDVYDGAIDESGARVYETITTTTTTTWSADGLGLRVETVVRSIPRTGETVVRSAVRTARCGSVTGGF